MTEVSFFPQYEQKENKVTNYTLLVLRQIYNESPNLFQSFIIDLLADEGRNINIGVNFLQQVGYSCERGNSIIDGVIQQLPFQIFIETKTTDWFYNDQLEHHIENLLNFNGQKIFIALANFDGLKEESKAFDAIKEKYKDEKDLIITKVEFEQLKYALENISDRIKSETLHNIIKEYEQFLDENNLLPTWKYRLDVVNCAVSKNDVINRKLYLCPEAKGAYKHARSKYFGIYENKNVNCIAEIKAVCMYDSKAKKNISISWFDSDNYKEEDIIKEATEKSKYCWDDGVQMFLLSDFKENINFNKDSRGGMFGSKIYFNFDEKVKDINDLETLIKNKKWSNFQ